METGNDRYHCSPVQCVWPPNDDPEPELSACEDGLDNDDDGLADYPADPGCESRADDDEFNPPVSIACDDGQDNDGDGKVDFPADPGCETASDDDEIDDQSPPTSACNDGVDNDGDGAIDYPNDSGCIDVEDESEATEVASCHDCICGHDKDGSGSIDQEGELVSCKRYPDGQLCPIEEQSCSEVFVEETDPETGETSLTPTQRCPSDPEAACIQNHQGEYRCSAHQCFDRNTVQGEQVEIDEPMPEGGEEVDENGQCTGSVHIFPGEGLRCRRSGTQTAWQNCCKNRAGKLADTMGEQGGQGQKEYKEEANSFEFWENQCDIEDQRVAQLADSGWCVYVGSYCKEKWTFVGCVQRANAYCCFNSKIAAIIHAQGRKQLPDMGGYGSAKNPNCRGFTAEEMQQIDFSKIDFSGYESELRYSNQQQVGAQRPTELQEKWQPDPETGGEP